MDNEVLGRVRELLPAIADNARATEVARCVSDDTVRDLTGAGVFRMMQPTRFGGLESDPVHFLEVIRAIAGACGSTGWVAAGLGMHPWHLALLDESAQADVWGEDPDTLIASSYAPLGTLVRVEGGYELRGSWRFSSGIDHCRWALLGGLLVDERGEVVDTATLLVPREDFRIGEGWESVGLRGTGSNEVFVERAFVPDHRIMRNYEYSQLRGPGQAVNTGPLYRIPFASIYSSAMAAPVLGVVSGCFEHFLGRMRDQVRLSLGGSRYVEDPVAQVAVARASSDIDASILQMDRNAGALMDLVTRGEPIPMSLRLRARRDQVMGTDRALAAIETLFKMSGVSALDAGSAIERGWRDAHTGAVHVANDTDRGLALYGRGAFGLPVEDNMV